MRLDKYKSYVITTINPDTPIGHVVRLTGGSSENELFLVDSDGSVYSCSRDSTSALQEGFYCFMDVYKNFGDVDDVAYSAELDKLFLAKAHTKEWIFVYSLNRTVDNLKLRWSYKQKNAFDVERYDQTSERYYIFLRLLRGTRLFVALNNTHSVHECRVHTNGFLRDCFQLTLPERHYGFDVQPLADNETRLVATLRNGSVALFRVASNRTLQLLSNATLHGATNPLLFNDTLLVTGGDHELRSFFIQGDRLQSDDLQIPDDYRKIFGWWFWNGTFCVSNQTDSKTFYRFNVSIELV